MSGRAVDAGFETRIAQAVKAALGDFEFLADFGQVAELFGGIAINDGGADRHGQKQVFAFATGAVFTAALLTVLGAIAGLKAVVDQGVEGFVRNQVHTPAVTTITPVGAAFGNKFFPPEAEATVASFARFYMNGRFIYKFHFLTPDRIFNWWL